MKKRVISATVLLAGLILSFYLGGIFLFLFADIIMLSCIFEFMRAFKNTRNNTFLLMLISQIHLILIFLDKMHDMTFTILVLILICGIYLIAGKIDIKSSFTTIFAFCYITLPISILYKLRKLSVYFFCSIIIMCIITDTFAYLTGSILGKNKLIPKLSPNKTIEGAVGGVVFCIIVMLLFNYYNPFETKNISFVFVFSLFGSIFSQIGDLFASSIKRNTQIKDFGKVIPGHGGFMDRVDSILFNTIYVYTVILFTNMIKI